jgi:sugar (pentulose or hexulose) kinase
MAPLIAVIDVGKSNAKLSFVDAETGLTLWRVKRANEAVHASDLRQLDLVGIERWLLEMFKAAPHKDRVSVIVPIAHGAAAVLVDEQGAVLAAPDYEDPKFATVSQEYESHRDAFEHTYSPSLPLGLNLGRQLYFLECKRHELFARARHALLHPQYWAWRFSGVMASEVTSLGSHSDLWRPREKGFSELAQDQRWTRLFPPLRFAGDTLGTITADVAKATGLRPACRVSCGTHDSNASYLQHLLAYDGEGPFCVISSGTWTVTMANDTDLTKLSAERDMLANVDVFSSPVGTARFMGGREYEAIAQSTALPHREALKVVLRQQSMAVPSFAAGGPFPEVRGLLLRADDLNGPERAALATLYVALMTDLAMDSLGAGGDIFLDGPLASNPLFGSMVAAWHPHRRVFDAPESNVCGTAASFLGGFPHRAARRSSAVAPLEMAGLEEHRSAWREMLPK